MTPTRPYLHIWNKSCPFPLCGACRFPMSFAEDIDRGQHLTCIAIAWPRASKQRARLRRPFRFPKETK